MESSSTAGSGEFREPVAVLTGFSAELWKSRRSFWRAGRISQGHSGIGGAKSRKAARGKVSLPRLGRPLRRTPPQRHKSTKAGEIMVGSRGGA